MIRPVPILESIARTLHYADLPETWRVPCLERFSTEKTLYDYQQDALKNAAAVLHRYYRPGENDARKRDLASLYNLHQVFPDGLFSVAQYGTLADRRNGHINPVFRILSDFIPPEGERIPYHHILNRMCFWMATGSGKTLIMVKLIEYLQELMERHEIPPQNILLLAPSEHLLGQIRKTVSEFNAAGRLQIELVPLRDRGRARQGFLGKTVTVYYHRSDNISDKRKEALIDYREYENDGKWYVLLDEAHKGGKEDSKRQAYYALMARKGFLFNFSATFTDPEDIVTTVKKYNLEEFIRHGHGKNIYLNGSEYAAFKNRTKEISGLEKRKIVLKSLITLAYASMRVAELRRTMGGDGLYHRPLMLTLVNSVNTDIENEQNDLWIFFQTLREISTGDIDESLFQTAKNELLNNWHDASMLFGEGGLKITAEDERTMARMEIPDLREAIFLSREKGAWQFIRSHDNKELAFQLKNTDKPFALIRIGDTSKWRNRLLVGFEETEAKLQEKSFFEGLEKSDITVLMGSRSFFESWDSNRPNVINFINIGGTDAKKFVVQSVGRGVRIEPLPGKRGRCVHLLPKLEGREKAVLERCHDRVASLETLFLFATDRSAIEGVLEGLELERDGAFEKVEGFEISPLPKINGQDMPLLVPVYREVEDRGAIRAKFAVSEESLNRLRIYLANTSDSVFTVRDGLTAQKVSGLRKAAEREENIQIKREKDYNDLFFLQNRLISHLSLTSQTTDGVRELDKEKDIVHFREIRARLQNYEMEDLCAKIRKVTRGSVSDDEKREWAGKFARDEIGEEELRERIEGVSQSEFRGLKIKNIASHYYVPVVMGETGKADFIQHIIKTDSETGFICHLEKWLRDQKPTWDAWMFSKIDESLDKICIPYYDSDCNEYRDFFPDFIFWMCKGDAYQIVFVDPKGMAHASSYSKIDGYAQLFEDKGRCRVFKATQLPSVQQVKVKLVMFNLESDKQPARQYARYWKNCPQAIFESCF